jgi:hypothetical protein
MAESERSQTADELRAQFGSDVFVTLPHGGTWHCRRPDLQTLLFEQILKLPVLEEVIAALAPHADGREKTIADGATMDSTSAAAFIRIWVSVAAKHPRIVLKAEDAGPDAMFVDDVPVSVRLAIFSQTNRGITPAAGSAPAAAAFPQVHDGTVPTGGSADVSRAPEPVAAADESR